jgi:uncharacterized protein YndB with AHSA1/START domain
VTKIDARTGAPDSATKREVVITRIFDVPRGLVFKAWTDPEHMARWWGPQGFTNPICELDARVGGAWRIVMRSPAGIEYPCGGVYREIVEPERLVFTNIATDNEGNPVLDGLTTVIFVEHGGNSLCKRALSRWSPMQPRTLQEWRRAGHKAWNASPKSWRDPKAFTNRGKNSLKRQRGELNAKNYHVLVVRRSGRGRRELPRTSMSPYLRIRGSLPCPVMATLVPVPRAAL